MRGEGFLSSFYKGIVVANMRIMLAFLCIISVVSTSKIACDLTEKTYFVDDAIWRNAIILVIGVIALYFVRKFIPHRRMVYLIIIFLASIIWVFTTGFTPRSDQMSLYAGMIGLRKGEYALFADGGYFMQNPQQFGLVFLYYLWSFIWGYERIWPFLILNVLAITFLYKKLGDICIHLGMDKKYKAYVALLGILFYPLMMYTTFFYGTLLGLSFAVAAIDHEIEFFDTFKLKHEICAMVFIILAVFAKTNCTIFMIGMLVYACVEVFRKRRRVTNIFLFVLLVSAVIAVKSPLIIEQKMTGMGDGRAVSSWSYVAMGLQEGPRSYGWFNSYTWGTYDSVDEEGNPNQAEVAKQEIKDRIKVFISNTDYAREFFLKKLASQWNNPTFEAYWVNQVSDPEIEQSDLIKAFISKQGCNGAYGYLDAFMMLVYFGALAAFWLKDDFDVKDLTLATVFIGGFLFHIFWEAKGQYTISYFVLLFPYAITGFKLIFERVRQKRRLNYKKVAMFAVVLALLLFVFGNKIGTLSADTESWNQYIQS